MQLEAFKKFIERQDIPLFDAKLLKKIKMKHSGSK